MLNEMPMQDRPGDEVLEDDSLLDKWYDGYVRKLATDAGNPMRGNGPSQPRQMYEG